MLPTLFSISGDVCADGQAQGGEKAEPNDPEAGDRRSGRQRHLKEGAERDMLFRQMGQDQGRIADVRDQAADHLWSKGCSSLASARSPQHADQHRQDRVQKVKDQFLHGSGHFICAITRRYRATASPSHGSRRGATS